MMSPDLTRLLEAIDTTEQHAAQVHREDCLYLAYSLDPENPDPTWECDCGVPDRIRRRCAVDRDLVGEARFAIERRTSGGQDAEALHACEVVVWNMVLDGLAEGYGLSDHQEGEE